MSCSVTERGSSSPATVQSVATKATIDPTTSLGTVDASTQSLCKDRKRPKGNSLAKLATSPSSRVPTQGAGGTPSGEAGPPQHGSQSASLQAPQQRSRPCGSMLLCCCCKYPWSDQGGKNDENGTTTKNSISDADASSASPGKMEEIRVSMEDIRNWGKSFDKIMMSGAGRKVFRNFLKGEYSEENILFWLACEEFKKHTDKSYIERRSKLIYMNYIHPDSSTEVSLDSRVREIIKKQLPDPQPSMYEEAQLQIYTLMQRDSYPRFVNSQLFKNLSQQTEKKGKEKVSIWIQVQKTPSLHTVEMISTEMLEGEQSHAGQSIPLLTAAHPAAITPASDFSDRDQDAD